MIRRKPEIRNPKSERSPKPEGRVDLRFWENITRILDARRARGFRISDFRLFIFHLSETGRFQTLQKPGGPLALK